jgi:hypothetical protein
MQFRRIIFVFLSVSSPLVFADALDVSLNNNAVAFEYSTSSGALTQGNSDFHLGVLYNGDSMNNLADAGMLVKGEEGDSAWMSLSVGAKVLVGMIKNYTPGTTQNVAAIVLGGELAYAFPALKQLNAGLFYFAGPKITTFGDASRAGQWGLSLAFEASPGTKVYVEYRETNFGITSTGQTATLDNATYTGVNLTF